MVDTFFWWWVSHSLEFVARLSCSTVSWPYLFIFPSQCPSVKGKFMAWRCPSSPQCCPNLGVQSLLFLVAWTQFLSAFRWQSEQFSGEVMLLSGALPDPVWFRSRICPLALELGGRVNSKSDYRGVWLHCTWILQFLPVAPVTQVYQLQSPFKIKLKLVCGLHSEKWKQWGMEYWKFLN